MERVEVERVKYTIRACETIEELVALVKVQRQIWGYAKTEVYPLRLFVTLRKIGGQVLGAFTHAALLWASWLPCLRGTEPTAIIIRFPLASCAHTKTGDWVKR